MQEQMEGGANILRKYLLDHCELNHDKNKEIVLIQMNWVDIGIN